MQGLLTFLLCGGLALGWPGPDGVSALETCHSYYLGHPFSTRRCDQYCCGRPTYQFCCSDCFSSIYALSCQPGGSQVTTIMSVAGAAVLLATVVLICWMIIKLCRARGNSSTVFRIAQLSRTDRAEDAGTTQPITSHDELNESRNIPPMYTHVKPGGAYSDYPILPPAYEDIPKTSLPAETPPPYPTRSKSSSSA